APTPISTPTFLATQRPTLTVSKIPLPIVQPKLSVLPVNPFPLLPTPLVEFLEITPNNISNGPDGVSIHISLHNLIPGDQVTVTIQSNSNG
ncbi:MAG TPA: hypothetical protein VIH79_05050, partial [Candidatus Nanopelagicaceae bacterium]